MKIVFQKFKSCKCSLQLEKRLENSSFSNFMSLHPVTSSTTLIASPSDVDYDDRVKSLRFKLKVKTYCWRIPKIINFSYLKQAVSMVQLYCQTCAEQEIESLTYKGVYLRIMSFQDEPNFLERSQPYIHVYQRKFEECLPEHRKILETCPKDYVPAEINMQTRGYFVWLKQIAWINRTIGLNDVILVDVKDAPEISDKFNPYVKAKYYHKGMYLGCMGSPLSSSLAEEYYSLITGVQNPNINARKHLNNLCGNISMFNPQFERLIPSVDFEFEGIDLVLIVSLD